MGRPALEVADIFRAYGPAWREAQQGHLSLGQLKAMSAIEQCRSAALGGHVLRCPACDHLEIAYNSCRNRHGPKCQGAAARRWLDARQADLLPVRVLSRRFRRRFLEALDQAHRAGRLRFFGDDAPLADATAFAEWLAPLRKCEWVVYAKRPFAGPAAVLAYLSRYTHRVAISNQRLIRLDEQGVSFRWKDYRAKTKACTKTMTLSADEFMRRFLLHVLPSDFHRIRHDGLLANAGRQENLARARQLLHVMPVDGADLREVAAPVGFLLSAFVCPDCGAAMIVVGVLMRGSDNP